MAGASPVAIMLAGPNGAGKTTTAMTLFRELLSPLDFVNADVIAQGLSGTDPDSVALEAGAIMLRRLHALADKRQGLAFETTGASRSFAPWLKTLKANGYRVLLYCFWLSSADLAISRVAARVRSGGHHVPSDTIRRRYDGGLRNFFSLYRPIADSWEMIDNSLIGNPRPVASGSTLAQLDVADAILWKEFASEIRPMTLQGHPARPIEPTKGMVVAALRAGAQKALRIHKALNNPVPTVKDGKVIMVDPKDFPIDDLPNQK